MQSPDTAVPVGPCACPGTPHDEDVVNLRPTLGLAAGVALQAAIVAANSAGLSAPAITGVLAEHYLLVGVESWNLVDDKGKPIPVTQDTIRSQLLDDFTRGSMASDRADELYADRYIVPLVRRAAKSSRSTTTNGSTSVTPIGSRRTAKKPSRPSSTTTTPTDATAATSG